MSNTYSVKLNNVEWAQINWKKIQRYVFKLQKRIYRASESGNIKQLRRLQKTLTRSWFARLLAIAQVTQDDRGKKTAGIDGVKALKPSQRLKLAEKLTLKQKPLPARRIYISQSGIEAKKSLSIPARRDLALQTLIKLALEPEWNARFESNSYGFRTKRSACDVIKTLYTQVNHKSQYVLKVNISKGFDRIDPQQLLKKLNTYPTLTRLIKSWLKTGWLFQEKLTAGIISSLLGNIVLHGMEKRLEQFAKSLQGYKPKLIGHLEDFVILHPNREVIQKVQEISIDWFKAIGLEINESNTRISHGNEGFDFLGFNVKQYPVGKHNSRKNLKGERVGFKTLIKPSQEKVNKYYQKIAETINKNKSASQTRLIAQLNPQIRAWTNYYSTIVSKDTFSKIDRLIWQALKKWCKRRHPNKSTQWVMKKYFKIIGNRKWVFSDGEVHLITHSEQPIVRDINLILPQDKNYQKGN
jgi:RNA-directed DNA polymerase